MNAIVATGYFPGFIGATGIGSPVLLPADRFAMSGVGANSANSSPGGLKGMLSNLLGVLGHRRSQTPAPEPQEPAKPREPIAMTLKADGGSRDISVSDTASFITLLLPEIEYVVEAILKGGQAAFEVEATKQGAEFHVNVQPEGSDRPRSLQVSVRMPVFYGNEPHGLTLLVEGYRALWAGGSEFLRTAEADGFKKDLLHSATIPLLTASGMLMASMPPAGKDGRVDHLYHPSMGDKLAATTEIFFRDYVVSLLELYLTPGSQFSFRQWIESFFLAQAKPLLG